MTPILSFSLLARRCYPTGAKEERAERQGTPVPNKALSLFLSLSLSLTHSLTLSLSLSLRHMEPVRPEAV